LRQVLSVTVNGDPVVLSAGATVADAVETH
jgi:hypothetical protein